MEIRENTWQSQDMPVETLRIVTQSLGNKLKEIFFSCGQPELHSNMRIWGPRSWIVHPMNAISNPVADFRKRSESIPQHFSCNRI